MKVFKFGGASVKDANAVKNVAEILKFFPKENILVVVSAMGKVTNALERLTDAIFYPAKNAGDRKEDASIILVEIKKYHFDIIEELFPSKDHLKVLWQLAYLMKQMNHLNAEMPVVIPLLLHMFDPYLM